MTTKWKHLSGSTAGTSHEYNGLPCQDYAECRLLSVETTPILIVVCADGAGSASQAEIGARLACKSFLDVASTALGNGLRVAEIARQQVLHWHEEARARLSGEAGLLNLEIGDYACTFLTAIVSHDAAVFSQIGDGAIVIGRDDGYQTIFWPQSGEYANTTFFLTGSDFAERLEVRSLDHDVDELALITDGLQPLALHYASRTVHSAFFAPMFESLRKADCPEELEGPLEEFLRSQAVNDRTEDDKTLVLATRRSPSNDRP